MPSSTMRTSVLQATTIFTFSAILNHHLSENMFDQVWENEAVLNLTNTWNRTTVNATHVTPGRLTLDAGNTTDTTLLLNQTTSLYNSTAINGTSSHREDPPESFYGRFLPREVVIHLVVSALQYWWLIWLERLLPARPRYNYVPPQQEEKMEESEDREEEVVKKWIAQGRVRRASLNWCNTFLKWTLEMTVGQLWTYTLEHVIRVPLMLKSPKRILDDLPSHLLFNVAAVYVSITPLATLIAFVIVPAHKQIVFIGGAKLVSSVFFTTVVRLFATWVVKTDYVQSMLRDMTEGAMLAEENLEGRSNFRTHGNEL